MTHCVCNITEKPSWGHLTWDVKGKIEFYGNGFKDVGCSHTFSFTNSSIPIKTVYVLLNICYMQSSESKGAKCTVSVIKDRGKGRCALISSIVYIV